MHLVHAVVALVRVAVALLITVRRALLRLHIQWLSVTIKCLVSLFRRRSLEPTGVAVDGGRVGRVRAGATVICRRRAERSTPRRRGSGRPASVRLYLRESRKAFARYCWSRRVVRIVPGVYWASGVDRRDRWQLQLYGIARNAAAASRKLEKFLAEISRVNSPDSRGR